MKNARDIQERAGGSGVSRGGFTLVEMLIAVAAVGLISVGLAKLFQKTGDTVKIGRRISNLNEQAAMIERTMREDFARMSPKGFLVMKHRLAPVVGDNTQAADIALTKDDLSARARRIDEVVFFAEGSFSSNREPLWPTRTVAGTAARVYYGHGLKQELDTSANRAAFTPQVDDTNADATLPAEARTFGAPGPNEFASNWILLRQQTVLSPPQGSASATRPAGVNSGPPNGQWGDSKVQVGLQPASIDVFDVIAKNYPANALPGAASTVRPGNGAAVRRPLCASGIVDIAATDLSQVQARVMNAQPLDPRRLANIRRDIDAPFTDYQRTDEDAPFALEWIDVKRADPYDRLLALGPGQSVSFPTQDPRTALFEWNDTSTVPTVARMKRWMINAFPADAYPLDGSELWRERRVRCEASPPDLIGTFAGTEPFGSDEAYRRTDQQMLTASNFVVGCTEFIVEWSYGTRYTSDPSDPAYASVPVELRGQTIWHGLARTADINGDGGVDAYEYVAHPYNSFEPSMQGATGLRAMQTRVFGGYTADRNGNNVRDGAERWFLRTDGSELPLHVFETALIHEPAPDPRAWQYPTETDDNRTMLFSCFGYVDPTFGYADASRGEVPRGGEPRTVNVPRPKLVRVTMSLVDSSEPLREQTYQFIFRLPQDGDQLPGT